LLIIAAILRFWVSWQPVEDLITKNIPDDSFYYFVIARNVTNLGSASLDGVGITNGFHPLWLVLILPFFMWARVGAELPIHLTLSLASLIDIGSVFLLVRLATNLLHDWRGGLIAGSIYAFHPFVILQVTNGLETSLGIFTALLFLIAYHDWLKSTSEGNGAIRVGFFGGLMFLARTDYILLYAAAILTAIWYLKSKNYVLSVFKVGIVSLATVSPWLLWSQLNLGKIVQDSGEAIPYTLHYTYAMEHPGIEAFLTKSAGLLLDKTLWLRGDYIGFPLIVGILFWVSALILLRRRWKSGHNRLESAILVPVLLASVSLVLVHAGIRWYPRPWYFILSSAGFALCLGVVTHDYFTKTKQMLTLAVLLTGIFVVTGQIFWNIGYYPWQSSMLEASQWLSSNTKENESTAAFNAGILSYYNSPKIVNLDGVVNHQAFDAIKRRALLDYAKTRGATYIIIDDRFDWDQFAPFMGSGFPASLEEVMSFQSSSHELGRLRVYRVK
jgi:hypothetical protein